MGWTAIRDALLLLALAPFFYYLLAIIAARQFFRKSATDVSTDFTPSISILKPIRGLDREASENFASFCRQDYPEFEIIFCVTDEREPAIPVIQEIIRDFEAHNSPKHTLRLLVGSEAAGSSDKANKLCRMSREARHDLLIVSDSDVRVEPGFLRAVASPFRDPTVGGVTCLYRGLADGSLPARLEALGNSTDFAPGVLAARALGGVNFMLGAVMATTKQRLAEIGGFESLADYLCDDYELGNRIAARGHRIELSSFPVSVVYPRETLPDAFRHQVRWNLAIRYSRPAGHFGLLFSQGLPWTILAVAIAPSIAISVAYLAAYAVLRAGVAWIVGARGMRDSSVPRNLWLLPLRDGFAFVVWLASFFPHRIHWRDQEFFVRDKRLVPIVPAGHK
ncbi:MAG: bacteriohopanetetrol glucosamine biosynthesis glycosyltransferase HpnI [Candidatus Acidiferrales bacterium]